MKADYIVEQPFRRRRVPRLRLILASLLLLASVPALILTYQEAGDGRPQPGGVSVITLTHPLSVDGTLPAPTVANPQPPLVEGIARPTPPLAAAAAAPALGGPILVSLAEQPVQALTPATNDKTAYADPDALAPESDADFGDPAPVPANAVSTHAPLTVETAPDWIEVTVTRGDTLSEIFSRNDLPAVDWIHMVKLDAGARLKGIRPGDEIQVRQSADGHVAELVYPINAGKTLRVIRTDEGYSADIEQKAFEHRRAYAQSTIKHSLYLAGDAAGLSDRLIMELTKIFAWKIDFARQIRTGDSFTVIYDQIWNGDEKIRNGDILAAQFVNRGEVYRAFRYTDADGNTNYYTADGDSLRKALLRAPLDYAYISSPFDRHRMHPILNIVRPHLGTDYAARAGTPVKAAGDGRVTFAGYKGGYGNVVVIRHNARYESLYSHLKGFAKGLDKGDAVKQGKVIGYVGATGLATGPHLHYGIRVDGSFRNARTVDLPNAKPVPEQYLADFQRRAQPLLARLEELDDGGTTRLARNR